MMASNHSKHLRCICDPCCADRILALADEHGMATFTSHMPGPTPRRDQ